jgi:hypothetical protein
MFFFKSKTSILPFLLMVTLATGCYKKDLEEFKKVNSWTYEPEIALPFLEERITLNDTIPTPPAFAEITMADTATVELPDNKDTLESIIESIDFKIRLTNTFPFNGDIQIYFADTNNVFQDSLLDNAQRIIPPGTNADPMVKDVLITVDKQRYIELTKNDQMFFYYKLTTNDITGINDDYLKVNMGIKAKLSVELDAKK